jgi:hypothetical protein
MSFPRILHQKKRTSATHAAMADAVKSDVNGSGGPLLGGAMAAARRRAR